MITVGLKRTTSPPGCQRERRKGSSSYGRIATVPSTQKNPSKNEWRANLFAQYRNDRQTLNGMLTVAHAFVMPCQNNLLLPFLLLGYSLNTIPPPDLATHVADPTHEFVLCNLLPEPAVDFDRNILDQNRLSPLTPPNVAFQFGSTTDEAFVASLADCVKAINAGRLSPEHLPDKTPWDRFFPTAVPLHYTPGDMARAGASLS